MPRSKLWWAFRQQRFPWHKPELQCRAWTEFHMAVFLDVIFFCKTVFFPPCFPLHTNLIPFFAFFFLHCSASYSLLGKLFKFSFSKVILSYSLLNYSQISKVMWLCNWVRRNCVPYAWALSRTLEAVCYWHVYNLRNLLLLTFCG